MFDEMFPGLTSKPADAAAAEDLINQSDCLKLDSHSEAVMILPHMMIQNNTSVVVLARCHI